MLPRQQRKKGGVIPKMGKIVDEMMRDIRRQLGIPLTNDDTWKFQLIYSVAGKMALASLWDEQMGESGGVKESHVNKRIREIIETYSDMLSSIQSEIIRSTNVLMKEIVQIYLQTGYFYKKGDLFVPSPEKLCGNEMVQLKRFSLFDEEWRMGGLGAYRRQAANGRISPGMVFGWGNQTWQGRLKELMESEEWEPLNAQEARWEYAAPVLNRKEFQWKTVPPEKDIFFMRRKHKEYDYALGKARGSKIVIKKIPQWYVQPFREGESIADRLYEIGIWICAGENKLPKHRGIVMNDMVKVSLAYELPTEEMNFFKLYSWPANIEISHWDHERIMPVPVFTLFEKEMETVGAAFSIEQRGMSAAGA